MHHISCYRKVGAKSGCCPLGRKGHPADTRTPTVVASRERSARPDTISVWVPLLWEFRKSYTASLRNLFSSSYYAIVPYRPFSSSFSLFLCSRPLISSFLIFHSHLLLPSSSRIFHAHLLLPFPPTLALTVHEQLPEPNTQSTALVTRLYRRHRTTPW